MYYDIYTVNEEAKFEMERLDRRAQEAWRFRDKKSKPVRALETALSSLLGALIR